MDKVVTLNGETLVDKTLRDRQRRLSVIDDLRGAVERGELTWFACVAGNAGPLYYSMSHDYYPEDAGRVHTGIELMRQNVLTGIGGI